MPILTNSSHELFAHAIAKGKSASDAYEAAGYARHDGNAGRLSKNEKIRARVEEILGAAAERAGITRERIQTELAKIAFSDIRKAIKWQSNLSEVSEDPETGEPAFRAFNQVQIIDSDKIDDETAAAISEISQAREGTLKLKMYDKQKALELLGKDIGMFKEKVEHSGPNGGPIETEKTVIIMPSNGRD